MNILKKVKNYYNGIYSIKDDYENKFFNKFLYIFCRFAYGLLNPKLFINFIKNIYIETYNSYLFIRSASPLKKFFFIKEFDSNKKNILAVCLRGMEECFFQIWYIMAKKIFLDSNFTVLSLKANKKINFLCKILGVRVFYFENISKKKKRFVKRINRKSK